MPRSAQSRFFSQALGDTRRRTWIAVVGIVSFHVGAQHVQAAPHRTRSHAATRVTGAPEHLQRVVRDHEAGTGPFVEIAPIDPSALGLAPYPPGVTVTGDMVTISHAPQNLWFEFRLGGWSAYGDLCTWQISVDTSSLHNGVGEDLRAPDPVSCARPADCPPVFGPGSTCFEAKCTFLFQDLNRDDFAVTGISAANENNLTLGSTALPFCESDTGVVFYGGNMVLTAPDGAGGTYVVRLRDDAATFLVTENDVIIAEYHSARVVLSAPSWCCHGNGACASESEQNCLAAGGVVVSACAGDCNDSGIDDACEALPDCNGNAFPDECEVVVSGDFDADGVVDLVDFGALHDCLAGPGAAPDCVASECLPTYLAAFDSDDDGDMDLLNLAAFQRWFTGP